MRKREKRWYDDSKSFARIFISRHDCLYGSDEQFALLMI